MLFVLQKIIWFLMLPPASMIVLITAGLLLQKRRKKAGFACIIAGVVLLYALSLAPVADLILRPLESAYPAVPDKAAADGVVVPGGGSVDLAWMGAEPAPNAETLARLVKGVELAKKLNIQLIVCGGNGEPFSTGLRDADVMAAAAVRMGLPQRQLLTENESRNTLENSYAVRRLFRQDRILLVTSAYYMRRAVTMFTRRGFTVTAVPVYYQTQSHKSNLSVLVPSARNLAGSSRGIAEWISMAWWHLRGEI